ncbi:MAG: hypothetical protein AB1831_12410 [Pseudomonadota bacterium]
MKFTQLPIGTRFEFEGRVYVKTGPIAAASESGAQRMIPRYAVLRPLDGALPPPPPPSTRQVEEAAVLAAFEAYHEECRRLLTSAVSDTVRLALARDGLAAARERFLAALRTD